MNAMHCIKISIDSADWAGALPDARSIAAAAAETALASQTQAIELSLVLTGDLTQVDLPQGVRSGMTDAIAILTGVEGISFVEFTDADVVRHALVARIVRAYDRQAAADKD